jgi:hypothetical protein
VAQDLSKAPVVIDFAPGSRLLRQEHPTGLPGTFVLLPNGETVQLPTDQVVYDEDVAGSARIGFGGLSFEGMHHEEGRGDEFVFWRVRDMVPEELQSPEERLTLAPGMVARILVQGNQVYPKAI